MTESDILGFTRTKYNGKSCYGCRGIGPRYMAFYNWAHSRSYKCVHVDMPWDYFIFVRHADEEEFLDNYSEDFTK